MKKHRSADNSIRLWAVVFWLLVWQGGSMALSALYPHGHLLLASPLAAADAPATLEGGWRLDWADEFNGSKLDPKQWQHELGVIRNQDAVQTYTKDCVKVRGGKLILISKAKEML